MNDLDMARLLARILCEKDPELREAWLRAEAHAQEMAAFYARAARAEAARAEP